jgi:hypothetical protein
MGSKNNPHNRGKNEKKQYKGEEIVPALFIDNGADKSGSGAAKKMMIAQYVKSRKPVLDASGKPLPWSAT